MSKIKVTLKKSGVNAKPKHRETLRSLGLRRPGDSGMKEDRPEIRGMANAVRHLVIMEEVD